jgi:gas vesicle protein
MSNETPASGQSAPQPSDGGFLSHLLGKAKEVGDQAKDLAGDALAKAKDFAEDLPENAQKLAGEASTAVKEFAEEFPKNAHNLANEAGNAVKNLVDTDKPEPPAKPPTTTA